MFERFTDRARKVMALANQAAQYADHSHIAPEHILLGLVKEGSGMAAIALRELSVNCESLSKTVKTLMSPPDAGSGGAGKLPQTPTAKLVVTRAIEEARAMNHNYVGTEHLLLGILNSGGGAASQALNRHAVQLEACRSLVLKLHASGAGDPTPPTPIPPYLESVPVSWHRYKGPNPGEVISQQGHDAPPIGAGSRRLFVYALLIIALVFAACWWAGGR